MVALVRLSSPRVVCKIEVVGFLDVVFTVSRPRCMIISFAGYIDT